MIFVTTGTQEPFDRLIQYVDELAPGFPGVDIYIQAFKGSYQPVNCTLMEFLSPVEFEKVFNDAELIVSHAGMGTIISALVKGKPIIIVPRKLEFKEHRSDHQLATSQKMQELGLLKVADDKDSLKNCILDFFANGNLEVSKIGQFASPELVKSINDFIKES